MEGQATPALQPHIQGNNDGEGTPGPSTAAGRLNRSLSFWKNILKPNEFILSVIRFGYRIPFVKLPTSCNLKNNLSSLKHNIFVRKEIEDLLRKGYVDEWEEKPFCVNPLTDVTVAESSKLRLCLDCHHTNEYIQYLPFKMEGWDMLTQLITHSSWFITWDYTAGYHHVPIHPDYRKYLGFSFHWGEKIRFFSFRVLPFGIKLCEL